MLAEGGRTGDDERSEMTSPAARNLIYGQAVFFCFLVACMVVSGQGFSHNRGFSFFGGNRSTVVLYALGFALAAVFFGRAALHLERAGGPGSRRLAGGLRIVIVLLLVDLSTPDTLNQFFYDIHIAASTLLFGFQMFFAVWVAWRVTWSIPGWSLLGAQFVAGISAGLSQLHLIAMLGESILVFQLAFGSLLVLAAAMLDPAEPVREIREY
jgi:hypothetical protein